CAVPPRSPAPRAFLSPGLVRDVVGLVLLLLFALAARGHVQRGEGGHDPKAPPNVDQRGPPSAALAQLVEALFGPAAPQIAVVSQVADGEPLLHGPFTAR